MNHLTSLLGPDVDVGMSRREQTTTSKSEEESSAVGKNMNPSSSRVEEADDDSALEGTRDAFILGFNVIKDISEATGILSPLKATCGLIIRGLETTREINNNKKAWKRLTNELNEQLSGLNGYIDQLDESLSTSPSLKVNLEQYAEHIHKVLLQALQAADRSKQPIYKRLAMTKIEPEKIAESIKDIDNAYKRFSESMDILLYQKIDRVENQIAKIRGGLAQQFTEMSQPSQARATERDISGAASVARQLHPGVPDVGAVRFTYGRDLPLCEEGTRVSIMERIQKWAEAPDTKEQIFWLRDAAGTGKTTVAVTMASRWIEERRLAGRFFFSPNTKKVEGIDIIDVFCSTVARDMAELQPSLRPFVNAAIESTPPLHFNLETQFERLIVAPLKKATSPLFLVFDALDNCEEGEDRRVRDRLLKAILKFLPAAPNARLLITSRPLSDISFHLNGSSLVHGSDVQLLDIHSTSKLDDIRIYVNRQLRNFNEKERELIVAQSNGLFIWAFTACTLLRKSRQYARIMDDITEEGTKGSLDALYMEALNQSLSERNAPDLLVKVLQVIINAYEPVSITTIQVILPDHDCVDQFVQNMASVLKDGDPHRPIRVLHPTFREFILHPTRPNGFVVNTVESHAVIALGSMKPLEAALKFDILNLSTKGCVLPRNSDITNLAALLAERLSPALRYASSYWPYHAAESFQKIDGFEPFRSFIENALLNWVELMSLRGQLPICVDGLTRLRRAFYHWTKTQEPNHQIQRDVAMLSQTCTFLLKHQAIIQESAMHVYTSPLISTPPTFALFQGYQTQYQSQMPVVISDQQLEWSEDTILTGHTDRIRALTFSSDGKRLVSASGEAIWLWDPLSGASIHGEKGYIHVGDQPIRHGLSWDGSRLAYATYDRKLHVWDTGRGANLFPTVELDDSAMAPLAVCPTQPYLVINGPYPRQTYFSKDNPNQYNLQFRHMETGEVVGGAMEFPGPIRCVSFSPDGKYLACGGMIHREEHGTVALWEVSTSTLANVVNSEDFYYNQGVCCLHGVGGTNCIAYSPTGESFVTGSSKGRLLLWEGTTAASIRYMYSARRYAWYDQEPDPAIPCHGKEILQIVYSPDGSRIASSAKDGTLLLWTGNGESVCPPLAGHAEIINMIAFSSSNDRLLSVSDDQTIRIWDAHTGAALPTLFSGFTGRYSAVAVSPDWTTLAIAKFDYGIHLVNIANGAQGDLAPTKNTYFGGEPPEVFRGLVKPCGFTPDGSTFISSIHGLKFWSFSRGNQADILQISPKVWVSTLAFSPHSDYVAVSNSETIQRWCIAERAPSGKPIITAKTRIESLAYAVNHVVASGFEDGTLQFWDINTHEDKGTVKANGCPKHMAFSTDGKRLAIRTSFACEVWFVESCSLIRRFPFNTGSSTPTMLVSPPTDKYVALKDEMELWLIPLDRRYNSSTLRATYLQGDPPRISDDGQYLIDGSSVWDISGYPKQVSGNGAAPILEQFAPLLSYHEGWIHSAHPAGRLLPIPSEWLGPVINWRACGSKIALSGPQGSTVIDCAPLL